MLVTESGKPHRLRLRAIARSPGWHLEAVELDVDDSEVKLEVARRMLEREAAEVECFDKAAGAQQRLTAGAANIDAVLMDEQWPGMDGSATTRAMGGELGLTALPVIALSAGAFVSGRGRAIDASMVDSVAKPLDPDTLIRTVRRHVEHARGTKRDLERRSKGKRARTTHAGVAGPGLRCPAGLLVARAGAARDTGDHAGRLAARGDGTARICARYRTAATAAGRTSDGRHASDARRRSSME